MCTRTIGRNCVGETELHLMHQTLCTIAFALWVGKYGPKKKNTISSCFLGQVYVVVAAALTLAVDSDAGFADFNSSAILLAMKMKCLEQPSIQQLI